METYTFILCAVLSFIYSVQADDFNFQDDSDLPQFEISDWQVPTPKALPPVTTQPVTNHAPPVSMTQPPVSMTQPPVSITQPPVSMTQPPVSTAKPMTTTQPPVSMTESPMSTEQPVSLTQPPLSTAQPESMTESPVSMTQPPVSMTQPPVSMTQPPVSMTQPLVSITQPPVSMTQPPVSMTQPPVSTAQPMTTTQPPVSMTQSPMSTEQPVSLTQPPLSTAQPESMTESPLSMTQPPVSTARPGTTTKPQPPRPEEGCALAYDDQWQYEGGNVREGYRFGTRNNSHIRFAWPGLPVRSQFTKKYDMMVTFRTSDAEGGLIFYATYKSAPNQFLALYMKQGQVHFAYNSNDNHVVSTATYNDNEWHRVQVMKLSSYELVYVDSELVGDFSVDGLDSPVLAPIYYGGLMYMTDTISQHLEGFYQPFKGCLKSLMVNGLLVTDIEEWVNSLRCNNNVEDGVYFGPSSNAHSNYLKLYGNIPLQVDYEFSISMFVKPRNSTGLLLSLQGEKDFLALELLGDEVVVNVDNGRGPFSASYKLDKFSLCDGNWHKIHVIKARHVVSVGVDDEYSNAGIGRGPSTDINSALYIGGHERPISEVPGAYSRRGFTGCIKNIIVNEYPVETPLSAASGNTHVGVCPVD